MKKTWKIWMKIAKKIMEFWADIFLTLIYIILIFPLSIVIKISFRRILFGRIKTKKGTYWISREKITYDLDWARQQ